jgi:hypothetical protein
MRISMIVIVVAGLCACDPLPQPCEVDGIFNGNVGVNRFDSPFGPPAFGASDDTNSWSYDATEAKKVFSRCEEINGWIEVSNTRVFNDSFFPNLKRVKGIGSFGEQIDEVAGFNDLESIQSIGPSIYKINGFNKIKDAQYIEANDIEESLGSLESVGYLAFGSVTRPLGIKKAGGLLIGAGKSGPHPDPLPDLIEIEEDFALFRSQYTFFPFERIKKIGGDAYIGDNGFMASFEGFSESATIGGNFTATTNSGLESTQIQAKLQEKNISISGKSVICFNFGRSDEDPCPEDFRLQVFRFSWE